VTEEFDSLDGGMMVVVVLKPRAAPSAKRLLSRSPEFTIAVIRIT
jgi:hypothetical protein